MSGAIKSAWGSAWGWSVRNSPIAIVWRSARTLYRPNREAFALLEQSELPRPIDAIIRDTIKRTKLWRDEREQVARELIAHSTDAIEAGRTPEQIVETFGEPKRVAKLLRRSMKRKRPMGWQLYRFTRRATAVLVVLLIVGYGWLALRFYTSSPDIKVDYGAQLALRNDGYSDDQKSWPIMSEQGFAWAKLEHELLQSNKDGMWLFPSVPTDHADYEDIVLAVESSSINLDLIREAGRRPIVGIPIGYELIKEKWGGTEWTTGVVPAESHTYQEESLIGLQLPNMGQARSLSQLLIFDARLAIDHGDTQRAVENYISTMGFAKQLHREPFLISRLVAIAIHQLVMTQVQEALTQDLSVFTAEQLIELAHTHAGFSEFTGLGLDTERLGMMDMLQRVYSDDGRGQGYMTAEGFEYFQEITQPTTDFGVASEHEQPQEGPLKAAVLPLTRAFSYSRETEAELYSDVLDSAQLILDRGPEWISRLDDSSWRLESQFARVQGNPIRFSFAAVMTPALNSAVNRWFQYQHNTGAFAAMLAIESYRIEHDRLPSSLDELVPNFLPDISADLMDPGHSLKYKAVDGAYLIYSVGSDGDDDGGKLVGQPKEPYYQNQEQWFGYRFRAKQYPVSVYAQPQLGEPYGPDGDWILIDTRPAQPDPEDS